MNQDFKNCLLANGFTQGGTKTTENNFQKGTIEIILNDSSFIRRKVHRGDIFSETNFKNADLALLETVISKQRSAVFFGKMTSQ
jgi:hypothetical protein